MRNITSFQQLLILILSLMSMSVSLAQETPQQVAPEQTSPEQTSPEQASPEQASPEQASPEQEISKPYPSLFLETETALTAPLKELRVGIWDAAYQISPRFNLKIWTAPSLLKVFNFGFRFHVFQKGRFVSNIDFHYATINFNSYLDSSSKSGEKRIHIVPIFFNAGWAFERVYLGMSLRFYTVEGNLSADSDSQLPFGTVLASSNQQLKLQFGYALGDRWSFWTFFNVVLHESYQGSGYLNTEVSQGIEVEAYGNAKVQTDRKAKSLGFRLVRKGDFVDFQIGFDRGQPPIYVTGLFFSEVSYVLPYLDLSFKF